MNLFVFLLVWDIVFMAVAGKTIWDRVKEYRNIEKIINQAEENHDEEDAND